MSIAKSIGILGLLASMLLVLAVSALSRGGF